MKFSGKICLMIILRVTKKTGIYPLSLENTVLKKLQGEQIELPAFLRLNP